MVLYNKFKEFIEKQEDDMLALIDCVISNYDYELLGTHTKSFSFREYIEMFDLHSEFIYLYIGHNLMFSFITKNNIEASDEIMELVEHHLKIYAIDYLKKNDWRRKFINYLKKVENE